MFSRCCSALSHNLKYDLSNTSKKSYSIFTQTIKLQQNSSYWVTIQRSFQKNHKPREWSLKTKTHSLFPKSGSAGDSSQTPFSLLLKPFCFTVAFSGCCFGCSAIWQYENLRSRAASMYHSQNEWWLNKRKSGSFRQEINRFWNALNDGQKVASGIIFLNIAVFSAWKVKNLQPVMLKYFASSPASKSVCLPMVLSTFSHYSGFHLFVNMYVLYSFSSGIGQILGKEQFLGTYLSAGVVSSFVSNAFKVLVKNSTVSLGASGAIMSMLGMVCTQFPDAKLAIVFLPFFTFSAGNALIGILAFDTAGLLLRWRIFDHASHLGGALFGVFYIKYGQKWTWDKREGMMKKWHEFRQGSRSS